ncbi:MAG: YndJ family transporter [Roseiflexaceae bacterium]
MIGGLAWLLLFAITLPGDTTTATIARLLLLAVLVVVPLALPLAAPPAGASRAALPHRAALLCQPFAAALVVLALLAPAGIPAALLASGWLLLSGLAALTGLFRLLARRNVRADELCIDAGLLYLPIGAVWLLFNRIGFGPLGFGDTIVILTAVHFHYAGFAAPILAGTAGRRIAAARPALWPLFRLVAAGVIAGIALVAAGITLARFTPVIEVAAAVLFAASLLALAALVLLVVVPTMRGRLAQTLLAISAASLVVTMLLAGGYALGRFVAGPLIDIPRMVQFHGWLNALGFVLCGLLAWTLTTDHRPPTTDR